jgi:hypothetical protein
MVKHLMMMVMMMKMMMLMMIFMMIFMMIIYVYNQSICLPASLHKSPVARGDPPRLQSRDPALG